MKVEILKEFKHGVDTYYPEEVVILDEATCKFWCDAGWAKDSAEIYPTGNPSLTDIVLFPKSIINDINLPEVGV
ncbi:MAG: hypothetical protein M0R47_18960 [Methylobacter sp.]|uniref:hypothetical protein n=1 Tax=Methylobacter sp. TaxID=2051955 RepID=UPI0025F608FA|nr:hypothetical protein [Methylobacter sp.]MCK9622602.1 hypothetical protein [Methylobacter sp.]